MATQGTFPVGLLWRHRAWDGSCPCQLLQNWEAATACSSVLRRHRRQCCPLALHAWLSHPSASRKALEMQERKAPKDTDKSCRLVALL